MTIEMLKIGSVLDSRPAGREAFLALRPTLGNNADSPMNKEHLTLDFHGVTLLTPSFADEFITPLTQLYPGRISFANTENITVQKTLAFLSKDWPEGTYAH
ncbi:DUF4325 domain-containing protein [Candidatus Peregrinibacteria bacterium]|nr:DUF4325 domain-containing protein [Candidatus Peregrinibacteria bacterium]